MKLYEERPPPWAVNVVLSVSHRGRGRSQAPALDTSDAAQESGGAGSTAKGTARSPIRAARNLSNCPLRWSKIRSPRCRRSPKMELFAHRRVLHWGQHATRGLPASQATIWVTAACRLHCPLSSQAPPRRSRHFLGQRTDIV
jgi:hypothetical protein